MRAKSFFYACLGVLALALAYHLGASTATAQAPGNPVVAMGLHYNGAVYVATANGDIYTSPYGTIFTRSGNVFASGPTPTQRESIGSVKVRYR